MDTGSGSVPGIGFRVTLGWSLKPSGSLSANCFISNILRSSTSVTDVLGSGFFVKVSGDQKSNSWWFHVDSNEGNESSLNLQLRNRAFCTIPVVGLMYLMILGESKPM